MISTLRSGTISPELPELIKQTDDVNKSLAYWVLYLKSKGQEKTTYKLKMQEYAKLRYFWLNEEGK